MAKKQVSVMNTAFRDGFQSVFGARVFTRDFLPGLEAAAAAGFTHFEAGGGARYQALYLYCRESAFDMMDSFRKTVGPDANLQTLSRGVNVVGLDSQSSDIIDLHAKLFKKHGMTTIRNFDALNDVRNLSFSGQCIADAGLNHEVVVTLMELPPGCEGAHTPEFYAQCLRDILDAGIPFSSVCFKDASGTSVPSKVYDSIKLARKLLPEGTHLRLHTHDTAGIAVMQYKAALDAGANGIDLAMKPVSGGTSQPDFATMWHALRGTDYDLGLDVEKVLAAEEVLKDCLKDYFIPPEALAVEPLIPFCPMPGGALTANTQMMRDNNMMDRYPKVIAKMGEVVRLGGYGTSVTPVSQFYFQQAFNNEIFGPWKRMAEGYGKMVLGYFGKTPVPPDAKVVALAEEQLKLAPTTRNPREINDEDPKKGISASTQRLKDSGLPVCDENIFVVATCLDKGVAFLKGESDLGVRKISVEPEPTASPSQEHLNVQVSGQDFLVEFAGEKAIVNGVPYAYSVASAEATGGSSQTTNAAGTPVKAELAARIFKLETTVGASVAKGDILLVLEALKMEIEVRSPLEGIVRALPAAVGAQVVVGETIAEIAG